MAGQSGGKFSEAEARVRAGLVQGHAITDLRDPEPLIDDLLPLDSIAVLFGPSGAGKSLVALDWALHVAAGRSWWGRKTARGPVLYVVAEGARGTKARYEAWCEYHGVDRVDAITWGTVAANVLQPEDREALRRIAGEIGPRLTVLDTLARHIPGGDENSSEAMSLVVETLEIIKRESGGCAGSVHHAGKDEGRGSRGHSALKGALDAELSLRTSRVDGVMHVEVYAEKFKDWEDHRVLYSAHMEKVGHSLVPSVDDGNPLRSSERQMLACLNGHWTTYTEWWKATGLAKGTFSRGQHHLIELGLVEKHPEKGYKVR